MILYNLSRVSLLWRTRCANEFLYLNQHRRNLSVLCKHLDISESQAEFISLKHPVVKKYTDAKMLELTDTIKDLGYPKEVLLEEPLLFALLPITLRNRFQVLKECAIKNVSPDHIVSYLPIVRQKTIGQLKSNETILSTVNIENRLASYMTQWPTSLTTLIYGDINDSTLYELRLKTIQRYLELVLDLSKEEFDRGLKTYRTIRHRPLAAINETLTILQSQIRMPPHKIRSNLYVVHSDPENLKNIIYKFQTIGGIDIKEVIRIYPKIALKNCTTLFQIKKVLKEYAIDNEAQRRCFQVYTLSPETIQERLEKARTIPEFATFFKHSRFLKVILYNNTAMKRLAKLYSNNKKCLSLNILSGSSQHFEVFEKAPGDRLGKGKDMVFFLSQMLGKTYRKSDLRNSIKRHPFWINIPLVQVQYVHEKLAKDYSAQDIYENCPILLYPWSKIQEALQVFKNKKMGNPFPFHHENLDLNKLNKSQELSLTLYWLEKHHYFTGNGVWVEEKNKIADSHVSEEVAAKAVSL